MPLTRSGFERENEAEWEWKFERWDLVAKVNQMRKNSWLSTQRKVLFAFPLCFMTVIAKIRPCSFHSFDPLVLRSLLWRSLFTGLFSARNRDIAQLSVPENPAYLWVGSFFNPFSDMSLAGSNDLSYTQLRHRSRARKKVVKGGYFPRNEPSITQLEVCLIFSITDYRGLVTCFWRAHGSVEVVSCLILQ